jgi:hypothetical protein
MVAGYREATPAVKTASVEETLKKFGELSTEDKEKFWELAKRG